MTVHFMAPYQGVPEMTPFKLINKNFVISHGCGAIFSELQ